jgi:hypothetical protein
LRFYETTVLGRLFGPRRRGETGGWKKDIGLIRTSKVSPNSVTVSKSRRMGWEGHAEGYRNKKVTCKMLMRNDHI